MASLVKKPYKMIEVYTILFLIFASRMSLKLYQPAISNILQSWQIIILKKPLTSVTIAVISSFPRHVNRYVIKQFQYIQYFTATE